VAFLAGVSGSLCVSSVGFGVWFVKLLRNVDGGFGLGF
jgi:hypothetical protein